MEFSAYKQFNVCFREVSQVFQGCFEEVLRVFQGRLKGGPRDLEG